MADPIRREFLKAAAGVTAATAVPGLHAGTNTPNPAAKAVKDHGRAGHMVSDEHDGVIRLYVQKRDGITPEQNTALKDGLREELAKKGHNVSSQWDVQGKVYVGPKNPKSGDGGNSDMLSEREMQDRTPRSRMSVFNNTPPSNEDVENHARDQQYEKSDVTVVSINAQNKSPEERRQMVNDISRDYADIQKGPVMSGPGLAPAAQ